MTARASREGIVWACPNCGGRAPYESAERKCSKCGSRLKVVTVREERNISWSGRLEPEVLSAALTFVDPPPKILQELHERTREERLSRASHDGEQELHPHAVDVLILTALPKELQAVLANSGPWSKRHDAQSGLEFYLTEAYHGLRIAATGMTGMGPVSSAVTTSAALTSLRPKRLVLVGICAGISPDVRLGDICVSDQIVDYDLGKVRDGKYTPRWRAFASDADLVRTAKLFHDSSWTQTILTKRPAGSDGVPNVHVGTILSGSKVIADRQVVKGLRAVWSQAVGLEMEGGGSAAAAHEHWSRPSFILIKGVCDKASAKKNDKWQNYAADAAGRYAISLLVDSSSSDALVQPPLVSRVPRLDDLTALGLERAELRVMLSEGFNLNELRILCDDLAIEWEELTPRDTRSNAALEIIGIFKRRRELPRLMEYIKSKRPALF